MIAQKYKKMLEGKSVIRQLSEFATEREHEIGYENVLDYQHWENSQKRSTDSNTLCSINNNFVYGSYFISYNR